MTYREYLMKQQKTDSLEAYREYLGKHDRVYPMMPWKMQIQYATVNYKYRFIETAWDMEREVSKVCI